MLLTKNIRNIFRSKIATLNEANCYINLDFQHNASTIHKVVEKYHKTQLSSVTAEPTTSECNVRRPNVITNFLILTSQSHPTEKSDQSIYKYLILLGQYQYVINVRGSRL